MGKIVFIASYKGGVGKTTVSAGIASALATMGQKVLVIDGDFHMRCMDLVLNSENDFIFDALDVLLGRCDASEAIIKNCGINGLDFLPAPLNFEDNTDILDNAEMLLDTIKDKYDFIIIDSGADTPGIYDAFASYSDEGVVVTFQQATAIRAAEVTAGKLADKGIDSIRLIINSFRQSGVRKKELPGVFESVTKTGIPLLGVIPYDNKIITHQEKGILPFSQIKTFLEKYEAAYGNIALRLLGKKIPLFDNMSLFSLRKKYTSDTTEEQVYVKQDSDNEQN